MIDRKEEVKRLRDEFYRIKTYCINCAYLDSHGFCDRYKMEVPLDYIDKENECEEHEIEIPF